MLTGQAAALHAGPAVSLSFVLAGIICAFAGLCYAEFASIIPIAGSAYTYGYATLGEFVAWIIGWDLVLEYAFGAATVASGWSGYFNSLLAAIAHLHSAATDGHAGHSTGASTRTVDAADARFPPGVSMRSACRTRPAIFNLVAMLAILAITTVLVIGIKESANFNSAIVIVKLGIVGIFMVLGGYFLLHASRAGPAQLASLHSARRMGTATSAGTALPRARPRSSSPTSALTPSRQPRRRPRIRKRDMPIGILGSLVVCTVLYILVSTILTGLVNYKELNVAAPVALGIKVTGVGWGELLVKIGAVFGLGTVMLVMLLGQSRVFFSMSKDGLLPKWASAIHPKFRTPWISTIVVGLIVAVMPAFLPIDRLAELVNIGTLLAFTIVCAGVWVLRVRHPELHRPFKTPLVPLVPILGIVTAVYLMTKLPLLPGR